MGNDGGSIPTRRELVKEAARPSNSTELKEKQKEHLAHRWSQCPVSHKALTKPIVADYTGDLYNKDAILQFLLPAEVSPLDKVEAGAFIQGRVKSLKDVVEVVFEVEKDDEDLSRIDEKWVCPVTKKELGVHTKAVFLVPCGHAFSREAIVEMKGDDTCPVCGGKYDKERDVVPILPSTDAEKQFVIERVITLKTLGLTHSLKKEKKYKSEGSSKKRKHEMNGESKHSGKAENGTSVIKAEATTAEKQKTSKITLDQSQLSTTKSGIKNAATANLTAKVLEEEESKKKRRLLANSENENLKSLYTKQNGNSKNTGSDFMTRGYSIPAKNAQR